MTRRLYGGLLGMVFVVNFGRVVFAPLVEPLQAAFDVGPATVGAVVSLVWFGTALPRLPLSYVLTRVSRRRIVVVSGVILTAAAALTASSPDLRTLRVGVFAVGVASGTYFVSAVPLIGELYPDRVGKRIGIHGTAAQLAAVAAPTVVVSVVAIATWRAVFWLLAAAALVTTLAFAVGLRRADRVPEEPPARNFRGVLGNWRVVLAGMLFISAAGFVWQGLFNFYVSVMLARGLAPGTANALLTVAFAAGIPAFWASGTLVDRLPTVPYILGLVGAFTAGVFGLTVFRGALALGAISVLLGYTIHGLFPALDTYVLSALPADTRAGTFAAFSGLSIAVEASGSGVVGALVEAGYPFAAVFRGFAAGLAVILGLAAALYWTDRLPAADRVASATES
ncbi:MULTISPECIES: MFS transporter [unclassified Halorubrum]|uniref:MFS transporter n=1 Tax=unclassified Halorubrum TaxID=2642239 RepID=UPI000B98E9BD|nr:MULTISPECIES: MFS transporter [unclassified Halorubrum]OYR43268.1 MFS transporter [Halorubrum sp. Hd13]OYR52035.1 MFS transporter [Halorubrum sp. Ea8]